MIQFLPYTEALPCRRGIKLWELRLCGSQATPKLNEHWTYRTQPCLVTNLVMNMVTNLVITKFGDELCDIFVTSFGDSLNWVMIFVTFLSLNLVGHQFE